MQDANPGQDVGKTGKALLVAFLPFGASDAKDARAVADCGWLPGVDLTLYRGEDSFRIIAEFESLGIDYCLRITHESHLAPVKLPHLKAVVVPIALAAKASAPSDLRTYIEVGDIREAEAAAAIPGVSGFVARGSESSPHAGEQPTWIIFRKLRALTDLPVIPWGGIGPIGLASYMLGGAGGVILDNQLLPYLTSTSQRVKAVLEGMDPTDTIIVKVKGNRVRMYGRMGMPSVKEAEALALKGDSKSVFYLMKNSLSGDDVMSRALPLGMDAALCKHLAKTYPNLRSLLTKMPADSLKLADETLADYPLAKGKGIAKLLRTELPIVQGPMANVSDNAEFARRVAEAGGLPVLGLGGLRDGVAELIEKTRDVTNGNFGVGIVAIEANAVSRDIQLAAIESSPPSHCVLAGGRPEVVERLTRKGIVTLNHAPRPLLAREFNANGTPIILEGNESGGHIGKLPSFILWESSILGAEPARLKGVLLAGGISDGLSALMASPFLMKLDDAGIQMGTAYLLTSDIVESGAVKRVYQEVVASCNHTAIMGERIGAPVRAAPTDRVEKGLELEYELYISDRPMAEKKLELEKLNFGGLYTAARGFQFDENRRNVELDPVAHRNRGIFMMGDAGCLTSDTITIKELHERIMSSRSMANLNRASWEAALRETVADKPSSPPSLEGFDLDRDIALVGLGCVLPDALTVEQYWQNLLDRKCSIQELPPGRWDASLYFNSDPEAPEKTYSKIGAFVSGFKFDPLEFKIPPSIAKHMDNSQRWMLRSVKDALRGVSMEGIDKSRVAVILGNSMGGENKEWTMMRIFFQQFAKRVEETDLPEDVRKKVIKALRTDVDATSIEITEDTMPGELANIISGRVANIFDFQGENFISDAACASSFAALSGAISSLRERRSDVVVSGAVDMSMGVQTYIKFSKIHALSGEGSYPYDERASGFVMGEGAVAYVLKRLGDAVKAGDTVYAVIKEVGSSSDGKAKGITAPNPKGQELAVRRALERAGLEPGQVIAIEGHGTATPVGDIAELTVLKEIFGNNPLLLSSVKSNIGHLKSAAGAAGLLKAVLSLHHRILPPTANLQQVRKDVNLHETGIVIPKEPTPLAGRPRLLMGVSSFGFGGTNFHVLLESFGDGRPIDASALAAMRKKEDDTPSTTPALSPFKERIVAVRGSREEVARILKEGAGGGIEPAFPGHFSISEGPVMVSFVIPSDKKAAEVFSLADRALSSGTPAPGIHISTDGVKRSIAFVFPGQGSQYLGMLSDLRARYPVVRKTMDEADKIMDGLLPKRLSSYIYDWKDEKLAFMELSMTDVTQPAILAVDTAIYRLLREFGVSPEMSAGHSLGEYAALVAADVLPFDRALRTVSARGKEMAAMDIPDKGGMAVVACDAETASSVLRTIDGYIIASNKNSPSQTVISGSNKSLETAIAAFTERGIKAQRIPVSAAFHSKIVTPAQAPLRKILEGVQPHAPAIPVFSNVTGEPYPHETNAIIDLLVEQVVSPVEWEKTVRNMHARNASLFIEVGPKWALTSFVRDTLKDAAEAVPANHPKRGDMYHFLDVLAAAFAAGTDVDFAKLGSASADKKTTATREPSQSQSGQAYTAQTQPAAASYVSPDARVEDIVRRHVKAAVEEIGRLPQPAAAGSRRAASKVVVTGVSLGLPGLQKPVFDADNYRMLLEGKTLIDTVPEPVRTAMLELKINKLVKGADGKAAYESAKSIDDVIQLAGQMGSFDLTAYGVPKEREPSYDLTTKLAVAAGLEALADAGVPLVKRDDPSLLGTGLEGNWALPQNMEEMGVIFASAFPGLDQFARVCAERGKAPFPKDFLFKVLSMGHCQLAQLIRAKGPNTQVNSACASTSVAMATAEDWIRSGRAKRVLVVAADCASSTDLLPFIGGGFLAAGGVTTEKDVTKAAIPFSPHRHGLIIGMGAVGLLLESEEAARERGAKARAAVVASHLGNSAFHGSRLDVKDIAGRLEGMVSSFCGEKGISREALASKTVFMSHETYTPARGGSASAEAEAIKRAFGAASKDIVISNTKGFTGHPMGVGIEESVAIMALDAGRAPPIANLHEVDEEFRGLTFSKGENKDYRFALRLAAGFGSQIAFILFEKGDPPATLAEKEAAFKGFSGKACKMTHDGRVLKAELAEGTESSSAEVLDGTVARVVSVISSATGYPPEVLKPDLDLEADLGIDTVKQVEIFAKVRDQFKMPVDPNVSLASYNTIRKIAGYVDSLKTPDDMESKVLQVISDNTGYPVEMLTREQRLEEDLGIDTIKQVEIFAKVRKQFEIQRIDDLKLSDYQTVGSIIDFVSKRRPKAKTPPKPTVIKAYRVVKAPAPDRETLPLPERVSIVGTMPDALDESLRQKGVSISAEAETAILIAKPGWDGVRDAFIKAKSLPASTKRLLIVGKGHRDDAGLSGLMGLAKSLGREPRFSSVRGILATEQKFVASIVDELAYATPPELYIEDDGVSVYMTSAGTLPKETNAGNDEVYLVTGASGGLMARILPVLMSKSRGTFILTGRESVADFKAHDQLRKLGKMHYIQAEITDSKGLVDAMRSLPAPTTVIHAAGIEVSESFEKKTLATFDKVTGIKAASLDGILSQLPKPPRRVVVFSSVAGRYGNQGQADYSSSNEEAVAIARRHAAKTGGSYLGIHWTAWGEIGMAAKPEIARIMELGGIDLVPPDVGIDMLMKFLLGGSEGEFVVAGNLGPIARGFQHQEAAKFAPAHPWGIAGTEDANGSSVEYDIRGSSQVIRDHSLNGLGILPGVMGLRLMSGALRGRKGEKAHLEGISFEAPFILTGDDQTLRVKARAEGESLTLENSSGSGRFRASISTRETIIFELKAEKGVQAAKEQIYQSYFHGPTFQVIAQGLNVTERSAEADCDINPTPELEPDALVNPLLVEAGMQVAGLTYLTSAHGTPLPLKMAVCMSEPVKGRVRIIARKNGDLFDVTGTQNGRTVLLIKGLEFSKPKSRTPPPPPSAGPNTPVARSSDADPSKLAPGERKVAEGFKSASRRHDFIAGRNAAHEALSLLGVTDAVVLRAPTGEPRVASNEDVQVSITHKGGVAYAVAWRGPMKLGIDAEDDYVDPAVADEALDESEHALVANGAELSVVFSLKEGYMKACGTGFAIPLLSVRVREIDLNSKRAVIDGPEGKADASFSYDDGKVVSIVAIKSTIDD